jgi:hypothetical protein
MSICDRCIHDYVCGLEDNHEEGIVSCADMIPKNVLNKIRAEIADMPKLYPFVDHIDTYVKVDDVLALIDKYRGEVSK